MPLASTPESSGNAAEPPLRDCRKRALDLLARREHSRLELHRKLVARGHSRELVDQVIEKLQQDKLLDEARFVEQFVGSRVGRGQGPAKIRAALRQRGVGDSFIDAMLEAAACDWAALADAARRKRFGADAPHERQERERQARFLRSRGFDFEQIRAALESAAESAVESRH